MLDTDVRFHASNESPLSTLEIPTLDALLSHRSYDIGCGAACSGETNMSPCEKCANMGRSNSALSSTRVRQERLPVAPDSYERDHQPVNWPANLDEDGTTNEYWATEMMRIRTQFWKPLGARLVWRWTVYSDPAATKN